MAFAGHGRTDHLERERQAVFFTQFRVAAQEDQAQFRVVDTRSEDIVRAG